MLLLIGSLPTYRTRFDGLGAVGLVCFIATAAWSLRVYSLPRSAAAVLAGLIGGFALIRMDGGVKHFWARLLLLVTGAGASAFALFGPAKGLF